MDIADDHWWFTLPTAAGGANSKHYQSKSHGEQSNFEICLHEESFQVNAYNVLK
jgi:hypothetical protein